MSDWRDNVEMMMVRAPRPWDRDYGGYAEHVRDFYAIKYIQARCDRERSDEASTPDKITRTRCRRG